MIKCSVYIRHIEVGTFSTWNKWHWLKRTIYPKISLLVSCYIEHEAECEALFSHKHKQKIKINKNRSSVWGTASYLCLPRIATYVEINEAKQYSLRIVV